VEEEGNYLNLMLPGPMQYESMTRSWISETRRALVGTSLILHESNREIFTSSAILFTQHCMRDMSKRGESGNSLGRGGGR